MSAPANSSLAIFGDADRVPQHDVELLFGDGKLYGHKFMLSAGFGLIAEMVDIEPGLRIVDLQSCPTGVTREAVAALMCFIYDEKFMPGIGEVRRQIPPLFTLEESAAYMSVKPVLKEAFWRQGRCICCESRSRVVYVGATCMCDNCWARAGNVEKPPVFTSSAHGAWWLPDFGCRKQVPYEAMWVLGIKEAPRTIVNAMCVAIRASPSKSCETFHILVESHLFAADRTFRLTKEQAVQVQDALSDDWCPLTQLGVHNLMALPGEYEVRQECVGIHCYLGFQDEKQQSSRAARHKSTGVVPHKSTMSQSDMMIIGNRCDC